MATILIVDDLAANRKFLTTLLSFHGHRVVEATDGGEGLATARAQHVNLIITDVLMPLMDGYELVRQLRLDPATAAIPVVLYTAHYGEREARALALSTGVSDVLTKPADSSDVLRVVSRVLAGGSGPEAPADIPPRATAFNRDHLQLLTDTLSETVGDLKTANARLRAVINIGLDLASERDSDRLLQHVCSAARDLFGATYVTLGILDRNEHTVERVLTCGADAAEWIRPGQPPPGVLGTVVADRRPLRGGNPGGEPVGIQLPPLHPEVQAYLAVPIASPTRVHGWICLVCNEGRAFAQDDEHLLVVLAGQVGRIYEVEHEILERQRAETALRQERDRTQRYLDTAEVILLALDLGGRITQINRKGCDLLGWTDRELVGRNWIDTCLPARTRDAVRAAFVNVIAGDQTIAENSILSRSGEERQIEWRNTVLRDDAGNVVGTFSSGTDITERKTAEAEIQRRAELSARGAEELRISEERVRFALEAARVGIWDMDYTTGVHRWSETLEAHYGLQPGTFGGTFDAFLERVHPDDRESLLETIGKATKSAGDFSVQHRAIRPDGTIRWMTGAGRIHFGENGAAVRAVGITMDVTERRTLELQYQQAQKMEAIGRLAGGVAHDFNNLLTAILWHCELLLSDLDPADPRRGDISEIEKAGTRAAALTRQLLAFSRSQVIEPTLFDLNDVVADMRAMLERLIGEDVKVVVGLDSEPSLLKADRGQVEQVVMNLALNARDAMPKGGTLTIETARTELDADYAAAHPSLGAGSYVVLRVSDTGTGMTPEVQARLFEPFFTTKEIGKGTGLGLATVHGVVTQAGGSVHVYSEVGMGTVLSVYFPKAAAADLIVDAPPPAPALPAGAQTVLVVEDAEPLRELTSRLLKRQGYTVLVAADAEEAIRVFEQSGSVDVLLTDIVLPGASGPELTRQLAERQPALKIVYMSGYTEEAFAQHGVLHPGIAFLHKPFSSAALGKKIREAIDRPAADLNSYVSVEP